jgi:hypothetical protein
MAFSGYKNQRRRTGKVGGRREGKKMVVPLFLLKETEEATERDHEQWRKKAASPPSRFCFFCCQRGVNTGNQQDAKTGELGGESEPPGERERERKKQTKQTRKNARDRTNGGKTDRQGGEEQKCINRGAGEKKNARDRISFNHLFTIFSNPSASRNPDRRRTPISSVQTTIIIDYRPHLPIIAQATTQEGRT